VTSPTRTDIYRINPPAGTWTSLDVGVDAVASNDTKISFFASDVACATEQVCVNAAASNTCEAATATAADLQTNAIFVAISSDILSSQVTARFKVH
jgi:hypothetical protein